MSSKTLQLINDSQNKHAVLHALETVRVRMVLAGYRPGDDVYEKCHALQDAITSDCHTAAALVRAQPDYVQ